MALESRLKLTEANFSVESDFIEVFSKKAGVIGVIHPNQIAPPSGVSGAIQFSNGSAFASDAANLFWDDTNNRLAIGTNAPTATAHLVGSSNTITDFALKVLNLRNQGILSVANDGCAQIGDFTGQGYNAQLSFLRPSGATRVTTFNQGNSNFTITNSNGNVTFQNTPITIVGSGSTSATTSLLVQNSAGTSLIKMTDDGQATIGQSTTNSGALLFQFPNVGVNGVFWGDSFTSIYGSITLSRGTGEMRIFTNAGGYFQTFYTNGAERMRLLDGGLVINGTTLNASASLQVDSTTRGFLPPRMTTTQINAIATPAEGLVAFNTTTSHLCVYQAGAWVKMNHSPM